MRRLTPGLLISLSLQDRNDFCLDGLSGDFDVFVRNVDVDFRAYAELSFEVNSRLDRKTNSGNDTPRIARFEIVDVDAITVSFFTNRMAGPMSELFAETCACNYATRDVVHFGAANRFTCADILANEIDRRIAGFPHNVENA